MPDKPKFHRFTEEEKQELNEKIKKKLEEEWKKNPVKYELPEQFKPGYVKSEEEIAEEKELNYLYSMLKKYGEMFPDSPVKDWENSITGDPDFPDMMLACIEKGIPMEELYPYEYDYHFDYEGEYGYIGPTHP